MPSFEPWHDFYMLLGTAAATLVGLTFVMASIGSGFLTTVQEAALQAFITPTVAHFSAVLCAALLVIAPFESGPLLGAWLVVEGLAGIFYSGWVSYNLRHQPFSATILLLDHGWYGLVPVLAYAIVTLAAVLLAMGHPHSMAALAVGLALLMVAGIRNAWDMTLFIATRPKTPDRT